MEMSRTDALELFASDDLIGIGMEADALRKRLHPEGVVSYALDGPIRYNDATPEQILNKIAPFIAMGATGITLQGEVSPGLDLPWFEASASPPSICTASPPARSSP
jgi:cyclic dehypoxanthinyl futalosine synthase